MLEEKEKDRYVEGIDMEQFIQMPMISRYNRNYHIGFECDLLYAKSDDDVLTEWYKVCGESTPLYIGYSLCDEGEILHLAPLHK